MADMTINELIALFTKALKLQKTYGTYATAKFLKNRGVSLNAALATLAPRRPVVI